MDWNGAYNVIVECLTVVMQIPLDTIKDMEISLDIAAGLYTVRFSSPFDLKDLLEYNYFPKISIVSSLTLFVIAILMIVPKIQERRKTCYEKDCGENS